MTANNTCLCERGSSGDTFTKLEASERVALRATPSTPKPCERESTLTTDNHSRPAAVRRWDDPPPDLEVPSAFSPRPSHLRAVQPEPYPERTQPHPGARQHTALDEHHHREFTSIDVESRLVVDPDVVPSDPMTADDPSPSETLTRHCEQPWLSSGAGRPVARWAVVLSLVANATIGLAIYLGRTPPTVAATAVAVVLAASAILIAAEHVCLRDGTRR